MNQGMLMESFNLAVAWKLPVIFVCKDNRWSITTHTAEVTAGDPARRARSFGLAIEQVRGYDVRAVHRVAGRLVERARAGRGPGFLHASCHRPGGHFEGDPLVRVLADPLGQAVQLSPGLWDGFRHNTTSGMRRAAGIGVLATRVTRVARDWTLSRRRDPLRRARPLLDSDVAGAIEREEAERLAPIVARARAAVADRPVFGVAAPAGQAAR